MLRQRARSSGVSISGPTCSSTTGLRRGTEAAAAAPEGCNVHGVDRAGFQKRRFQVLAALAGLCRVMVDATTIGAPEEAMPGADGEAAVAVLCLQGAQHRIDLVPAGEGGGALQEHQLRFQRSLLFQHVEGMQQCRFRTGGVAGDGGRAPNHAGALGFGGCRNGVIVGAHHHSAHGLAGLGCPDAAADQGHPPPLKVFARNAFGASAGGDQGQRTTGDCHR